MRKHTVNFISQGKLDQNFLGTTTVIILWPGKFRMIGILLFRQIAEIRWKFPFKYLILWSSKLKSVAKKITLFCLFVVHFQWMWLISPSPLTCFGGSSSGDWAWSGWLADDIFYHRLRDFQDFLDLLKK